MNRKDFNEALQKRNAIEIEGLIIFSDYEVYNLITDETIEYTTLDEVMLHEISGITIEELIKDNDRYLDIKFGGGRGASSGMVGGGLFSNQRNGGGKDNTTYDLPARMNRLYNGNMQSFENSLDVFRRSHANSDIEHAVIMDDNGFVSTYKHGNKDSVSFQDGELQGKVIIHNHPSGGYSNFSKADLITFASTGSKGIVASSKKGDYIIRAKGNFNPKGLIKAVNKAKSTTGNYDKDVDKFLKSSAKDYGFEYVYRRAS